SHGPGGNSRAASAARTSRHGSAPADDTRTAKKHGVLTAQPWLQPLGHVGQHGQAGSRRSSAADARASATLSSALIARQQQPSDSPSAQQQQHFTDSFGAADAGRTDSGIGCGALANKNAARHRQENSFCPFRREIMESRPLARNDS